MITGIGGDASVGPQTLEKAKDILDEYFIVAGTIEQFDASLLLMEERLE
jgi:hypothetical protein